MFAPLAHLVEHWSYEPKVAGSIPAWSIVLRNQKRKVFGPPTGKILVADGKFAPLVARMT